MSLEEKNILGKALDSFFVCFTGFVFAFVLDSLYKFMNCYMSFFIGIV